MVMIFEIVVVDGFVRFECIFKEIDEKIILYIYCLLMGLFFVIQFIQFVLILMEKVSFEDMKVKGFVFRDSIFVGYFFGEYFVLVVFVDVMFIEFLVFVVFYCGLIM